MEMEVEAMSDLFSILSKIQAKPAIYLGTPSVSDLFMFLVGYKTAQRELGRSLTAAELQFYREFQPWLQAKYQITTNKSWAKIIQFYARDDREAFDRFFELFDEFQTVLVPEPELVA
jgi:hypothetical protein